MLDRETHSIKELQGDCLPLGVDADKLEAQFPLNNSNGQYFLSDEEFELVMGMSKGKYYALPGNQKFEIRESGLGLLRELRVQYSI